MAAAAELQSVPLLLDGRLAKIFAACDQARVRYCLLRGYDELPAEGDLEIDVLVAGDHLPAFAKILASQGFAPMPAWGHAPHHFFLGYDRELGRWLKFDAVTVLRFGAPVRALQIDLAEEFLRKRKREHGVFTLSSEDEFFALILHGLLDKGHFRPGRSARLIELRQQIRQRSEAWHNLRENVVRHLEPALDEHALVRACELQDFRALLPRRKWLVRQLAQRQRLAQLWRKFSGQALRRLRPVLFAVRRPGLAVALLAPDGAGKSTLAAALKNDSGLRAQLIYMGTNVEASTIGLPTTKWLHRRLKSKEEKARWPKPMRTMLKPVNYLNRVVEQWYRCAFIVYQKRRGRFVVCDRYVYDAWVAKPISRGLKRLRRALLEWGWPTPDVVIFLDAPAEVLFARKGEHSVAWLEKQRAAYLGLQTRLPQMHVVDAMQNPEEVKREVIALIWDKYRTRQAQPARAEVATPHVHTVS